LGGEKKTEFDQTTFEESEGLSENAGRSGKKGTTKCGFGEDKWFKRKWKKKKFCSKKS